MTFRSWDQLTVVEQLQCNFSDFYKDVHGFRPRGASTEQWNSEDWLREQIDSLHQESSLVAAEEDRAEKLAIAKFEEQVQLVIDTGAKDRKTAIRWIFEADDEYVINEPDYFCFLRGLPYGYFKEAA